MHAARSFRGRDTAKLAALADDESRQGNQDEEQKDA